jgi:hypothetical protein
MAGTTGLEPATSDVTGRGRKRGFWIYRSIFNLFRDSQRAIAVILGIDQPKVSALKQGKLSGFSIERLMRFLLLLGRDIEITVKGKSGRRSMARLRVA